MSLEYNVMSNSGEQKIFWNGKYFLKRDQFWYIVGVKLFTPKIKYHILF